MKWTKTEKPLWHGLPWPGEYKPVNGYSSEYFFISKGHRYWTLRYINSDGNLVGIGKRLPDGLTTADFSTLKEAKTAANRLCASNLVPMPAVPTEDYLKQLTEVLLDA